MVKKIKNANANTDKTYNLYSIKDVKEIYNMLPEVDFPITSRKGTLLQLCCVISYNTEPIEFLLEHGASPYVMDEYGLNAFDYALKNNNWNAGHLNYLILAKHVEQKSFF